jgi:PAS domain S-box-containing protein
MVASEEGGGAPPGELRELRELRARVAQLEKQVTQRGSPEGEEQFRLMADAAPVMLWASGADGLCTFFNRPWLEFRGRAMEQELGDGWAEGVHPDDRSQCLEAYQRHFAAREAFRMEYRLRRADGEYCWIVDTGVPRYIPDGAFAGYIGSAIVITDQLRDRQKHADLNPALSRRELQVLTLVAEGKSTREAAAILGISYKTADSHRTRLMEKLGVHETAGLVHYAIRIGLVKP